MSWIISLLLLLYDLPFNSGTLNNIRLSLPMERSTVSQMILGLLFTSLHFSEISDSAATRDASVALSLVLLVTLLRFDV